MLHDLAISQPAGVVILRSSSCPQHPAPADRSRVVTDVIFALPLVWDFETQLRADRSHQSGGHFSVTGNGRHPRTIGAAPLRVLGAFADLARSVRLKVALQVAKLQRISVSSSASLRPARTSSSSSSGARTTCSASRTFSRASSRVRPWL